MKKLWSVQYIVLLDGGIIFNGNHLISAEGIRIAIEEISKVVNGSLLIGRGVEFEITSASEIRWGQ